MIRQTRPRFSEKIMRYQRHSGGIRFDLNESCFSRGNPINFAKLNTKGVLRPRLSPIGQEMVGAVTSPSHRRLAILLAFVLAANPMQTLLEKAHAEVHITGKPDAVAIEAREASVEELLGALSETYDLQYRTPAGLDLPISGSFAGPLPQAVARALDRYDFAMETSAGGIRVTVYGRSGSRFNTSNSVPPPGSDFSPPAMYSSRRGHGQGAHN